MSLSTSSASVTPCESSNPRVRLDLNDFFISIQLKALRQTEFAVKNKDDALDIVQDAMERLAKNYSDRSEDWGPLFQRILQNAIRDWYRKQRVKRLLFWSEPSTNGLSDARQSETDGNQMLNGAASTPVLEQQVATEREHARAITALQLLPLRQQQAFILRAWWGNNVAETAFVMNCSTGSVKTHYSRAVARLKQLLEDDI